METIILDRDINLFYITAKSFPEGIMDAHTRIHELVPSSTDRKFFGISRPENGPIVYKAAAEELHPGEAEKLHCDKFVLKKGKYTGLTLKDYTKDKDSISKAFKEILKLPNLDPNGYCVEWYLTDKEVKCMVKVQE